MRFKAEDVCSYVSLFHFGKTPNPPLRLSFHICNVGGSATKCEDVPKTRSTWPGTHSAQEVLLLALLFFVNHYRLPHWVCVCFVISGLTWLCITPWARARYNLYTSELEEVLAHMYTHTHVLSVCMHTPRTSTFEIVRA